MSAVINVKIPSAVAQEQSINNAETNERDSRFGIESLIKITDDQYCDSNLYYDVNTLNVYYWNGRIHSQSATMPTVCYASNGLQYKYDPDAHSLIEPDISQYIVEKE